MLQEAHEINLDYLSKRENRIAYIKAEKMESYEQAVIAQAKRDAVDENTRKFVRNLRKMKMSTEKIMEATELTKAQVESYLD